MNIYRFNEIAVEKMESFEDINGEFIFIYFAYNENEECIYIGQTNNLNLRFNEHIKNKTKNPSFWVM